MIQKNRVGEMFRLFVLCGAPAAIIWLGSRSLDRIRHLYDGLCVMQGPGAAVLLYDDNPQGYCTGIGDDLYILHVITFAAAVCSAVTLIALWRFLDGEKLR